LGVPPCPTRIASRTTVARQNSRKEVNPMKGSIIQIDDATLKNQNYRQVLSPPKPREHDAGTSFILEKSSEMEQLPAILRTLAGKIRNS
jgi:hypothetical protein